MSKGNRGLTLIEVLLTSILLSIIVAFASPSLRNLLYSNYLEVVIKQLEEALQWSKLEALSTRKTLILTALDGNDWSSGVVLKINDSDRVIRKWQWGYSGLHVTWQGFQSKHYLRFSAFMEKNSVNGYFLIENPIKNPVKIVVNRLARVNVDSL